jgi:uncharacterized membrane protein
MPTTRLEAFSDGVFAITILVLDLRVPPPALAHGGRLGHFLLAFDYVFNRLPDPSDRLAE